MERATSAAADGFVGRDAELAALGDALAAAGRRHSALAAVVGEPGIGKTRLVRELCSLAERNGHLVLYGRAAEFARDDAFSLFLDALDDHLGTLGADALEALGAARTAELARVFPALARLAGPATTPTLQEERHRAHRAVRALLERLGCERPLLLALDDVHWADDASLELISHLGHRRARAAIAVVLAFRSRQAPERLRVAIAAGERDSGLVRVELEPLTRAAADRLLGGGVAAERRAELYRESGGNPFYLEQLSRELPAAARARTPAAATGGPLAEVPAAVRAALAHEIAALSDVAASFLRGAAVVGEPFAPELAALAAALAPEQAIAGLDEALAADVVRPTEVPTQFRFRHPLVRRGVYESIAPGWRLAAHGRLASALAERGAPPAARARHVECSAHVGDERAIAVLSAAARDAAPRAPASAAHWYGAALRLLERGDARRLELLAAMATALGAAGRLVDSREALRATINAAGPELPSLRVPLLPFVGLIEHLLGNHDAVAPLLRRALKELPDQGSREAAMLRIELAADRFYMNDSVGLHVLSRAAHAVAVASADPALIAAASGLAAVGAYKVGEIAEAEARFWDGVRLARRLEDVELAPYLQSLFWLGWYGQCAERYLESLEALERGIGVGRATGQGYLHVPMLVASGILLTWLGRLDEASGITEEAIDAARSSLNDQFLGWSLTLRSWIASLAGEASTAVALGREAVEASSRVNEHYFSKLSSCYLADALLEAGDPSACREQLLAAVDGPELEPLERPFRPHFYDVLTRAELALGDIASAERWTELAEHAIAGIPLPARIAEARRARAAVALARGDPRSAADTALESVALWEERANAVEAARTRVLAGVALAADGARGEATRQLERAHRELSARGAARHADAAARELRRLGRRVPRSGTQGHGATGVAALSGREREIAGQVSEGKTNKEIAAALYLSPKTVEGHLSRIFAKLGVSSRAKLAREVERARRGA